MLEHFEVEEVQVKIEKGIVPFVIAKDFLKMDEAAGALTLSDAKILFDWDSILTTAERFLAMVQKE